ncbi:MAG: glycine cleavage system protein GcvH [Candidatus Methanomethylophilaceae archaeon]
MDDVREGLLYNEMHEWMMVDGENVTFGMTDHAQQELGDVVYVDLPDIGDEITMNDEIGALESVKTIEPIYAPVTGTVISVNGLLADAPQNINISPYDDGWMMVIKMADPSEKDILMDVGEYREFMKK